MVEWWNGGNGGMINGDATLNGENGEMVEWWKWWNGGNGGNAAVDNIHLQWTK